MKKILAVLLAAMLLCALFCGCQQEQKQGTEPDEDSRQTDFTGNPQTVDPVPEPAESEKSIQQRLDDGEELLIGLSFQGLTDEFTLIQKQYLDAEFGALGFTTVTAESNGDTALMIQQMENFVTMGAVLIIGFPPDAESVMDVSLKAIEAGTYVVFTGLQTSDAGYEVSGGSSIDWKDLGTNMARMGLAWADAVYPDVGDGELHVALGEFSYFSQSILLFDALKATLNADPRITITYEEDMIITVDQGFNAAENAFTVDPDVRLFFCFQESGAQGMNQYIMSQPLDYGLYGVFTQGTAQNSREIVELSRTNESVYRGTIVYGTDENPAAPVFRVSCDLLFDAAEPPHWDILQQHSINGFGFEV